MTETAQASRQRTDVVHSSAHTSALRYAEHGWPVLPGSAWNGRRYQVPGTGRTTDGVRPVVPRNHATIDPDIISGWWAPGRGLQPTVLLRSGPAFLVFSVARERADAVLTNEAFQDRPGPVVYRPDRGRLYFMVTPVSEPPRHQFGGKPDDVTLLEPGSWILVPPAYLLPGVNAGWRVPPEPTKWQLADFTLVADLLKQTAGIRTLAANG